MKIRKLQADEMDVRVQMVKEKGYSVLLYKNARCDMKILDETFGIFGWQREHEVINDNLFCTVSIYDKETNSWIRKQDVGIESYTEKEKGQASDSFKRACFNIGIGRELYTAPFIWINGLQGEISGSNGKFKVYSKLRVAEIQYNENDEISHLTIVDDKGNQRYQMGTNLQTTQENVSQTNNNLITQPQQKRLFAIAKSNAELVKGVIKNYGHESTSTITKQEYQGICDDIEHLIEVAGK